MDLSRLTDPVINECLFSIGIYSIRKEYKNLVPVSFACVLHTSISPSQQFPSELGTMSSILCHTLPSSLRPPSQHGTGTLKLQWKALSDLEFLGLYSLLKWLQGEKPLALH